MKKIIQEEISRTKELMGILNESDTNISIICPVGNYCSKRYRGNLDITGFNATRDKGTRQHSAQDFGCPSGTEVFAPADGTVLYADFTSGGRLCGGFVKINHNGFDTIYCHLKQINVTAGQKVVQGDTLLGLSGGGADDKGRGRTDGPHLHFAIKVNNVAVDPLTILDSGSVDIKQTEKDKQDQNWIDEVKKYAEDLKKKSKEKYDEFLKYKIDGIPIELYVLGIKKKVTDSFEKYWDEAKKKFEDSFIPDVKVSIDDVISAYYCLSYPPIGNIYKTATSKYPLHSEDEIDNGETIYYREYRHPEVNVPVLVIMKNDEIKVYSKATKEEIVCE